MKGVNWIAAVMGCCIAAGVAQAATVYEQALPDGWLIDSTASALCSPCSTGEFTDPTQRIYATFDLEGPAKLDGLEFAVINNALAPLGDFSVSIWRQLDRKKDKPFREIVFSGGSYDPGRSIVDVALPGWTLAKGTYWLSIVGLGEGGGLLWGYDPSVVGDDFLFRDDLLVPPPDYHVGFRLYENDHNPHARTDSTLSLLAFNAEPAAVPVPGTLGLFALGLGALGLARRRAHPV